MNKVKLVLLKRILFIRWLITSLTQLTMVNSCAGQAPICWTITERNDYGTFTEFCKFLELHGPGPSTRDSIISRFINFDYVLQDSSRTRIDRRMGFLDTLLKQFKGFVDSIGVSNLDARPVRYYEKDSVFYLPFSLDLQKDVAHCFAFFDKRHPRSPSGYLLFDEKTARLISWVMVNQGGYYYFLTFDLI